LSKQEKKIDAQSLAQKLAVDVKKVNVNVSQEMIIITEDKVKLCLMKYLENMEKRSSWTTPLAIFLTVVVTLLTTSFKVFIVSSEVWQAVFIIIGGLSLFWLIISLYKRPKAKKIEDVIKELKAATKENGKA
jgi:Flp pilus assembly protein TadB